MERTDLEQFEEAERSQAVGALDKALDGLGPALLSHGGDHGLLIKPDGSFHRAPPPCDCGEPDPDYLTDADIADMVKP